jgi:Ras-related protein Rab-11A
MTYDARFKVVVFGDEDVGSSLLLKRATSDFIYDTTLSIGVDFWVKEKREGVKLREKVLKVKGSIVKLLILRLSAEERFGYLLPRYVKGANGAILMYDVASPSTLEYISDWTSLVRKSVGNIPIVLVGVKIDQVGDYAVSNDNAMELVETMKLDDYIECDAKTGDNVEELFETITKLMVKRVNYS